MTAILICLNNITRNNVVGNSIPWYTHMQARSAHYVSSSNNSRISRRSNSKCNSRENAMTLKSIFRQSKICNYSKESSGITHKMITFLHRLLIQITTPLTNISDTVEFIKLICDWMSDSRFINSLLSNISISLSLLIYIKQNPFYLSCLLPLPPLLISTNIYLIEVLMKISLSK